MPANPLTKIDKLWWIAALYFLGAMLWVACLPQNTFWSLDEGGKFIYLQSVLQSGQIQTPLVYPGADLDPQASFPPLYFYLWEDSQLYTWWPVWFPLLSLPFYRLFGWSGLFILPAASGALSVLLSGKIMRLVAPDQERLAYAAALLTGLATPLAFYSTRFWEHAPACSLFLLSAWLLLSALKAAQPTMRLLLAGMAGAAAAWLRLDILPILFGLGLCLLWLNWRQALLWGASFSLPFLTSLALNQSLSGNIFGPTYLSIQAAPLGRLLPDLAQNIAHILFNAPAVGAYPLPTWLLASGVLALLTGFALAFIPRLHPLALLANLWVITLCAWVLSQSYDYRSVHGFVLVSPLVLFAGWLAAFKARWKDSPLIPLALSGMLSFAIVFLLRGWQAAGGLQFGPRYLLSLYPLLVILGLLAWSQVSTHFQPVLRKAWRMAFLSAALLSLAYQGAGLYNTWQTLAFYHSSAAHYPPPGETIYHTRCTWLSMVLPELYWRGDLFAGDPSAWQAHLRAQAIPYYTEIDMLACNTQPLRQVAEGYQQTPGGLTMQVIQIGEE